MKKVVAVRRIRMLFWASLFAAYSVAATGVVIDVLGQDYSGMSGVAVTTAYSPLEKRIAGAAQVAAAYRAGSGAPFSALPTGSTFKVVWPDGSSEHVTVVNVFSSDGVQPIPGSQQPPPEATGAPR